MTTTPPSPRLLLVSSLVLAALGVALLGLPHGPHPSASEPSSAATAKRSSATAAPAADKTADGRARSVAPTAPTGSAPRVREPALPLLGEGVAGDRVVQRSLETAWPAGLPVHDERELLAAGRELLRADATGVGRSRWPLVFPGRSGRAVAPAFATARFRIQAAIARSNGSRDRAVVHLVWAGTDRGGTFTDLRITDWHFTRTMTKGSPTWTPLPPT
ncbi:hypothetical protein J8N05_18840 [Streptomyces sp. BH-SS-21]|uniref:Uncharacterized protein n=1 Tax=Streptomyces liliiviolaceus TaxID=2823109 RepID=A0A940XZW4_9ACTN|nr:hypothetical protein [Streptomyces liliiviolaceus]MBQ0850251.1 hypothetical protein [Streptomyces liliiviolaceus]